MNFEKAARPLVMGRNGLVSSGHYLASLAGVKVLQEGGNAVDAALAAAFVMTVVRSETCGPGGDVFALVCMKKSGKVTALNSGGPAPAKASIEYFREQRLDAVPVSGPLSIAVPGAVDGWLELHKRYGTKELSPITSDYRYYLVYEQPPVSQGFMVLEMLNIVEAWALHDGKMNRADVIDCQVGAKKLAFEDRIRHLEDPAFGDLKISMLISKEYA